MKIEPTVTDHGAGLSSPNTGQLTPSDIILNDDLRYVGGEILLWHASEHVRKLSRCY
jgi:hypothetical protein